MMRIFRFKPRTPDEDLARHVREAAKMYNNAVKKATDAGLGVSVSAHSWHGSHYVFISDMKLQDIRITRNVRTRL